MENSVSSVSKDIDLCVCERGCVELKKWKCANVLLGHFQLVWKLKAHTLTQMENYSLANIINYVICSGLSRDLVTSKGVY